MSKCYDRYFKVNMGRIGNALDSINNEEMDALIDACEKTLISGHKVIASGLGKNVPICEKFVGSMLSMGMDAGFLHTNSAVHGDMGMVKPGDLVIVLTKSGSTAESVYLVEQLKKRNGVQLWLLSGNKESILTEEVEHKIIFALEHEGDQWDILPNNSTTVNLIVLQTLAIELSVRLGITINEFKPNHPGGAIGEALR